METLSGPPEMTQQAVREPDSVCKPVTLSHFPLPRQPWEGKQRQTNSKVIALLGMLSPQKGWEIYELNRRLNPELADQLNRYYMKSISAVIIVNTKES